MKQQKQNKQVVDDFKQEKKKKQRVHFLNEMVGNLKIFLLVYIIIILLMTVLLCGVISGLFAFFILGFLIFVGILYYLFRHKKSIPWIDFFIINEYYFFHIHRSFLEAKYLLVLHQYEHDLKVTYKVLIDQYHHR